MKPRPLALLAELTYRCPLHCPYCSNPVIGPAGQELSEAEWGNVLAQAADLGVMQVGFSGGEPLQRPDLEAVVAKAAELQFYTNLITSGMGFTAARAAALRMAGLRSIQLSFQAHEPCLSDQIAGTKAHAQKLAVARLIREAGFAFSMNIVLHRQNIASLPDLVSMAVELGAERLELANVQYYGWAYLNRKHLLPTREQVVLAASQAAELAKRHRGRVEVLYVLPDWYETQPKPCMSGWGQRYLTVTPVGLALPCPTATSIPDLQFPSVRQHSLEWIWGDSPAFNRFRGTDWMPLPCRECPRKEVDFGGCRCQAALISGDAATTDPVCSLSGNHQRVQEFLAEIDEGDALSDRGPRWMPRIMKQRLPEQV